jgi:allophanate hydrolase
VDRQGQISFFSLGVAAGFCYRKIFDLKEIYGCLPGCLSTCLTVSDFSLAETVAAIAEAYRSGTLSPTDIIARCFERISAHGDDTVFISLRDRAKVFAQAKALAMEGHEGRPLYGIPVAIKDNIDVKGMATTAGCPAFAYSAARDATAVARLKRAGAIIIGKTNLDQFATGLVGIRSPYGIPRNPHNPKLIPGGSSSGSAVAVAAGLVPLALGTDTAGSGRVPAGINNIVGLKPSRGLISTTGVVPACRSLDCVSILALTVDDAWTGLVAMAGVDAGDPYTRDVPLGTVGQLPPVIRVGVPRANEREFCGDRRSQASYEFILKLIAKLGMKIVGIDFTPFLQAARLLYEGPWLAERYAAVGEFIAKHPKDVHPVTRKIILGGKNSSAVDAFRAFYRLAELRAKAQTLLSRVDVLMVPTMPAAYSVSEVKADPVRLNSNLGIYTNFVNLLDLAGLAVPATIASDGTPYGVTFLAPAGQDALLASIGRVVHAETRLPLGAIAALQPEVKAQTAEPASDEIALAVVGAHLSGMPLNDELKKLGARFLRATSTAPEYRLYALSQTTPRKPGLLRVASGAGVAIAIELWALTPEAFGRFVAAVPPPLAIGTLQLADRRCVKGFLVEAEAVTDALDISDFGGWRAFMESENKRSRS